MKTFREKVMYYGTLLTVFIFPLIVVQSLFAPYISIKIYFFYTMIEFISIFFVYNVIVDKTYRLDKRQLLFFMPIILYVFWLTLAGILAVNPSLSFYGTMERGTGLVTLYHLLIFLFIIVSLVNHHGKDFVIKLIKYFLVSSLIVVISVWFDNEGFNLSWKTLSGSNGGGFIGNSSFAAAYFIFSLSFCFYLLSQKVVNKGWKIFSSVIFLTIIFSPLFLNIRGFLLGGGILGSARGALIGIIVGLFASIFIYLFLSSKKVFKFLGFILIIFSLFVFSYSWHELVKPDTYLHNKFIDVAAGNRFTFWDISQKSMKEHPYFGYGPENYAIAFSKYFDDRIFDNRHLPEISDKAHNIYFDTGVYGGYPAIFLYAVFMVSLFCGLYRLYKIGKYSRIQVSILSGMIVAYIFQNLFIFDSPVSLVALFIILGIVYGEQKETLILKHPKTKVDTYFLNLISGILFISFLFSFTTFVYKPFEKSRNFTRLMSLNLDERPSEYMKLLDGSKVGNDWDASSFLYQIGQKYSEQINNIKSHKEIIPYVDKDLSASLEYANKLAEINKTDYRLYLSMLHLYNIKINIINRKYDPTEFDHILSIIDKAHQLSPRDPQVYWEAGFLMIFQENDPNKALAEYRNAIYLDKTSKVSWDMMLKFLKMTNQQKLYDITLEEAQKSIPDFKYQPF